MKWIYVYRNVLQVDTLDFDPYLARYCDIVETRVLFYWNPHAILGWKPIRYGYGKFDDTENLRVINRTKCMAFRETRDAGADFITKEWIGKKNERGKTFVQEWWQKSEEDFFKSNLPCFGKTT